MGLLPWWWVAAAIALGMALFAGIIAHGYGRDFLDLDRARHRWVPTPLDGVATGLGMLCGWLMHAAGMGVLWLLLRLGMSLWARLTARL